MMSIFVLQIWSMIFLAQITLQLIIYVCMFKSE